jgi:hypothetical protein
MRTESGCISIGEGVSKYQIHPLLALATIRIAAREAGIACVDDSSSRRLRRVTVGERWTLKSFPCAMRARC